MSIPATTSATGGAAAATLFGATNRQTEKALSQDDFLKLLVAQLSTQDPLNPTSETDFTAQLAQFSALEQTKAMYGELASMRDQQEFLQANNLLGRTVALQGEDGVSETGIVTGVTMVAGRPQLLVNGEVRHMSDVLSVMLPPTVP